MRHLRKLPKKITDPIYYRIRRAVGSNFACYRSLDHERMHIFKKYTDNYDYSASQLVHSLWMDKELAPFAKECEDAIIQVANALRVFANQCLNDENLSKVFIILGNGQVFFRFKDKTQSETFEYKSFVEKLDLNIYLHNEKIACLLSKIIEGQELSDVRSMIRHDAHLCIHQIMIQEFPDSWSIFNYGNVQIYKNHRMELH